MEYGNKAIVVGGRAGTWEILDPGDSVCACESRLLGGEPYL